VADSPDRGAIDEEFSKLAALCALNAEHLRHRARDWKRVDVILNLIAAVLAGLAATTGLADLVGKNTVSYLALASAVAVAARASLSAATLGKARETASLDFHAIHTDADQWRRLDLNQTSWERSRAELDALTKRCNEAYKLTTSVSFTLEAARRRSAVKKVLGRWRAKTGAARV
jgi:hypothetical protein